MNQWSVSDGAYIKIKFDRPLTGAAGNEARFTVRWQEYDYVPNGHINVERSAHPVSTFAAGNDAVVLEMAGLERFHNAAVGAVERSGSIITINNAAAAEILSLVTQVEPKQSGSGDPSTTNIRPIAHWNGMDVIVSQGAESRTTHIDWTNEAGEIYGFELDVVNGLLTVTHEGLIFRGTDDEGWNQFYNGEKKLFRRYIEGRTTNNNMLRGCSHYPNASVISSNTNLGYYAYTSTAIHTGAVTLNIRPDLSVINTLEQWKAFLAEQYAAGTPVTCYYNIVNPTTYQLTPAQIALFLGCNEITTDIGDPITATLPYQSEITVSYDGGGTLQGVGGAVEPFEVTFLPHDLIAKPNQHPVENIEIADIAAMSELTRVYYSEAKADENVQIASISATAVLTDIGDL